MNGVLLIEVENRAGVALEQVDQLALVPFVDGPEDLVTGAKRAAIKVSELRGNRERRAVGVPSEAREGKREISFRVRDDIAVRGDLTGEPKDGLTLS